MKCVLHSEVDAGSQCDHCGVWLCPACVERHTGSMWIWCETCEKKYCYNCEEPKPAHRCSDCKMLFCEDCMPDDVTDYTLCRVCSGDETPEDDSEEDSENNDSDCEIIKGVFFSARTIKPPNRPVDKKKEKQLVDTKTRRHKET